MNIRTETYFLIAAKDQPGTLARITATLMKADVDMSGLWGFGTGGDQARVMAVPRDISRFKQVAREAEWKIEEHICFHCEGQDRAGALVDILNKLAAEGVNLISVDAIGIDGQFGCYIWPHDEDVIQISEILGLRSPLI